MLLRPRKFPHKNIHKRRSFRFSGGTKFRFGQVGLVILQPLRLNSKQLYRYKLFLKKASRRSDRTLRYVWFNLFPHLPISRKVEGSRMGKGKGKLAGWSSEVPAGLNIIESKNLRSGRSIYFLNQIRFKLPAQSRIVFRTQRRIPLILRSSKYVNYDVVW